MLHAVRTPPYQTSPAAHPASAAANPATILLNTTIHRHTPPYTSLHPVLFLYELIRCPFEKLQRLKMTQYAMLELGPHMHKFKRHETKKYRDGVCLSLNCKFAPIDPDGNCFFAAVSTAMAHFYDQPLCITAQDCRARVVAWLIDCKVRALPPTTTTHHHSDTPPPTIHHHTPLHHHLRPTTQTHTPLYTSLLQDGQHGDVGEACRLSMIDELAYPLVRSVGNKGKTKLIDVNTIDAYVNNSAEDRTWVQGTYSTVHLRTPPHTISHLHR